MVLWDLALVDFDSVKVTTFTGKSPDSKDPLLNWVFTDLGSKAIASWGYLAPIEGTPKNESDSSIQPARVASGLSKCLTIENFSKFKKGFFMFTLSHYIFKPREEVPKVFLDSEPKSHALDCLNILGVKLQEDASELDVLSAVENMLPKGPAFTTWVNGQIAFWKSVQENEMKLHRLADWLPAK